MKKIGLYGGTFNPPHLGHIQAAQGAVKALGLEKLLLIPAREAPHKSVPSDAPTPDQRLEMVTLAAQGLEGVEVCDLELRRQGPSYSYETVAQVKERFPQRELVLLMGSDMLLSFDSWVNAPQILESASLGVFCRGDKGETAAIQEKKQQLESRGARVYFIDHPAVPISSTQLRRLLAFHSGGEFLPQGVESYIQSQGLYHWGENWKGLPMEQLEAVVVSLLKPSRIAHVLGCRDTAVALARHWGADPVDAARAGLLHDVTKALDGPLQLTLCRDYGKMLGDFSRKYPKTLHALTGSLVAQRIFGENPAVVSAIRSHTTGKAEMNLLETILYVADYMEPNRDFPGVEKLRELAYTDIYGALKLGLHMTLEHLARQGSEISPETRQTLAWLEG